MSVLKPGLADRYEKVKSNLALAEKESLRAAGSVFLLPVSKTFDIEAIREAVGCGMHAFGENYVQEGIEKIRWFRENAERLSEQRPVELGPLNVLIEVHISGEDSKGGCEPMDVPALAQAVTTLPNLKLRGLMAIPAPSDTEEGKKAPLREMFSLYTQLKDMGFDIDTLSMGMSSDMKEAVECGSTMVRVGSAIFGPRDYGNKASK